MKKLSCGSLRVILFVALNAFTSRAQFAQTFGGSFGGRTVAVASTGVKLFGPSFHTYAGPLPTQWQHYQQLPSGRDFDISILTPWENKFSTLNTNQQGNSNFHTMERFVQRFFIQHGSINNSIYNQLSTPQRYQLPPPQRYQPSPPQRYQPLPPQKYQPSIQLLPPLRNTNLIQLPTHPPIQSSTHPSTQSPSQPPIHESSTVPITSKPRTVAPDFDIYDIICDIFKTSSNSPQPTPASALKHETPVELSSDVVYPDSSRFVRKQNDYEYPSTGIDPK